ncbi:hypothetical protein [Geomicrobium sp. JCM 19037]|uniref:hypothetical protein n=1 Tax=Geomicrobium sp. JCM 19037 TaxID=1460634 RepID=UPI0012690F8B|nr:hypothetical protein [Geomicrobium sp. JCM 19037]
MNIKGSPVIMKGSEHEARKVKGKTPGVIGMIPDFQIISGQNMGDIVTHMDAIVIEESYSKDEYDNIVKDNEDLLKKLSDQAQDKSELTTDYNKIKADCDDLVLENTRLKSEMAETEQYYLKKLDTQKLVLPDDVCSEIQALLDDGAFRTSIVAGAVPKEMNRAIVRFVQRSKEDRDLLFDALSKGFISESEDRKNVAQDWYDKAVVSNNQAAIELAQGMAKDLGITLKKSS